MGRRTPDEEDLPIRFVNTVAWRLREPNEERLRSPAALLAWLGRNLAARPRAVDDIRQEWRLNPLAATKAYETGIQLREALYGLFIACIARREPPSSDLAILNHFLWRRPTSLRIQWDGNLLIWSSHGADDNALDLLQLIALSAAELLTGSRAHKIRQCQDDRGCGWLFVDESRLQNRRWCSMGDCGNLAKARRHRLRLRQTRT
jgi:predicted RNA-binding Zn ribbon-like protein